MITSRSNVFIYNIPTMLFPLLRLQFSLRRSSTLSCYWALSLEISSVNHIYSIEIRRYIVLVSLSTTRYYSLCTVYHQRINTTSFLQKSQFLTSIVTKSYSAGPDSGTKLRTPFWVPLSGKFRFVEVHKKSISRVQHQRGL